MKNNFIFLPKFCRNYHGVLVNDKKFNNYWLFTIHFTSLLVNQSEDGSVSAAPTLPASYNTQTKQADAIR